MDLFYGQIDGIIKKRLNAMENGYKPDSSAGVDLLDLFLQSTNDLYTLGGMVFAFLSAGRRWSNCDPEFTAENLTHTYRRYHRIFPLMAHEGDSP